ncbi:MAG: sulfurtransferase complex subunit TusB [Methylococcaceae bacterium]
MLHIIAQSTLNNAMLERTNPGDYLVFIESAVFILVKDSAMGKKVNNFSDQRKFYALEADLQLRGLQKNQIINNVTLIDYAEFVDLVVTYPPVASWR